MHQENEKRLKSGTIPPWEELGRGTRKSPKGASEILKKYFDIHQIETAGDYHTFFSSWKEIVGLDLFAHSNPVDIQNNTLLIEADHPGWMQMLNLRKSEILRTIRQKFPQLQIRRLRIMLYSGSQKRSEPQVMEERKQPAEMETEDRHHDILPSPEGTISSDNLKDENHPVESENLSVLDGPGKERLKKALEKLRKGLRSI